MSDPTENSEFDLSAPPYGVVVRGEFVSVKDGYDFMDDVFKNNECPWCHSHNWDLILRATEIEQDQEDGYVVYTTEHYVDVGNEDGITARPPAQPFTYPMFLVICDTCGFTRTHSLLSLQRWKERRNAVDEGNRLSGEE